MPQTPVEELDALVIGAGVTGLFQLHCLRQLGVNARIYEAGEGVGGTSPLSDGAIVAREPGIPCVINTVDGTRRFRSGDQLRIDGSSGLVEVLS
jgi:cation diffusion facilitator CzcD-associated flavoprotein CzcO